jgi:hypothetical protein
MVDFTALPESLPGKAKYPRKKMSLSTIKTGRLGRVRPGSDQ